MEVRVEAWAEFIKTGATPFVRTSRDQPQQAAQSLFVYRGVDVLPLLPSIVQKSVSLFLIVFLFVKFSLFAML